MNKKEIKSFLDNLNDKLAIPPSLLTFLRKSVVSTIKKFGKNKKTLEISFILNQPLSIKLHETYLNFVKQFKNKSKEPYFKFNFVVEDSLWKNELISNSIQEIYKKDKNSVFYAEAIELVNDKFYQMVFSNQDNKDQFDQELSWLANRLESLGFYHINLTSKLDLNLVSVTSIKQEAKRTKPKANKVAKEEGLGLEECKEENKILSSSQITEIKDFDPNKTTSLTTLWAKIYHFDYKKNGTNKILKIGLADKDNAVTIISWISRAKHLTSEYLEGFKIGNWIKIQLRITSGKEDRKYIEILRMDRADQPEWLKPSPEDFLNRHEFFFHTKMSIHDGLNVVDDLKAFCEQNKIKNIAITDTGVVQAFADLSSWKAKTDSESKVHYGLEVDLFDDRDFIVKNNKDLRLDQLSFVVFDIETTGLNAYYEQIIEIGAIRIKAELNQTNNQLEFVQIDKFEKFIKNEKPLSEFTKKLTGIKDSDLKDAQDEKTVLTEFANFIKDDDVLVAHNGIDFDFIWINTKLDKYKLKKLNNPMLDTLRLAYQLYLMKSYTLKKVSDKLGYDYDDNLAHRATYDAELLAKCLMKMLSQVYAKKWRSLLDLNDQEKLLNDLSEKQRKNAANLDKNDEEANENLTLFNENLFNRIRLRKALVYARNSKGLKALYKLVSLSSTEQFYGSPKLFWSDLEKYKDDILVSSHPLNGQIVHAAKYDTNDNLRKIIKKHNFVLVPLPSLFKQDIYKKNIEISHVHDIVNRIISICEQEGVLYTFSSAAHYLKKEQKRFYECLITAEITGKKLHHFYDRDLSTNQCVPDLHIRKNNEVYSDFGFIKDSEILAKLTYRNGEEIAKLFDDEGLLPFPKKLHPPKIEGSDDKLVELVWNRANELFGDEIDPIIKSRIEYELDAIIKNGYGIVYWLAHLLVKKSNDDGYIVGSRGSVGSSVVALLAGISEVNPLEPYYYCNKCKKTKFVDNIDDGHDLVNKPCEFTPCDGEMKGEGHNIPFASFMGFKGEKTPDIDLNFSSFYQSKAHDYVRELFGESHTTRCGTITTMQDKTAFRIAKDYLEQSLGEEASERLAGWYASEMSEIKRTTGQHPGGILVFPKDKEIEDFCPVNYPADDKTSKWKTSHFKFEYLHDTLLKLDILAQEDPTILKYLYETTNVKPEDIPNNDRDVLSLFNIDHCLESVNKNPILKGATGALGIPEFGTKTTRDILKIAQPASVADLIRVSGLSHGTDVWSNNAADLIVDKNYKLNEVIACRDDIMTYLSSIGIEKQIAFNIMEDVRKGKKLKPEYEKIMNEFNVSQDYIDSCNKIKYMFPKAHATAYVLMAWKIAWFKVHYPQAFYAAIFSFKAKEHDIETCINGGIEAITRRYNDIKSLINKSKYSKTKTEQALSKKDEDLIPTYELYLEMLERGIKLEQVSLEHSDALHFVVKNNKIYPPFNAINGLGDEIAKLIVKKRNEEGFRSQADLKLKCKLNKNIWNYFTTYKVFGDLKADEKIRLY
ncbi:PolC-type DNA polymerase III [[Mycoplasma] imitans]|uniref:PolC-type DNA polymerase III n=1 Tax=[Mycoplasma] imitans TaxID=29560 RepID=UPI0004875884|nr:PolC-type DNA polymerase III [[Mycoplasma] imitans]